MSSNYSVIAILDSLDGSKIVDSSFTTLHAARLRAMRILAKGVESLGGNTEGRTFYPVHRIHKIRVEKA